MSGYSEQRIDQLIDECSKAALQQIIGPFGLSVAMFNDRDGGAVDTVHNAKKGIMSEELKSDFEDRGEYDSQKVHSAKAYVNKNRKLSEQKALGQGVDAYSGKRLAINANTDLDHVMAAKEIHDDPARVLAQIDTADLANLDANLQMTLRHTNRSMKQMSIEDYIAKLDKTRTGRQAEIKKLEGKANLTDQERKRLANLKEEETFDPELARKLDREARKAIQKAENRYYTSAKFAKNQLKASGKEASTNAIRAALGELLVVLVNQTFLEVKSFINERGVAADNIFVEIQNRLKRIVAKVIQKLSKWKENLQNLAEGFIAGFCSSLVTTLINIFATTAKRFVRAIREGFFSLVKAFRLLFFRPAEMTEEEAMKTIIKLLSSVVVTTLGIAAEMTINTFIQGVPVVGQFASIITPAVMSILTGIAIALISYYVDMAFHFFKMREETFSNLLESSKLQGVYFELLAKTGERFIAMGESYSHMIETNSEVMYGFDQIESSTNRICRFYSSFNQAELALATGHSEMTNAFKGSLSAHKELENEVDEILAWVAHRQNV